MPLQTELNDPLILMDMSPERSELLVKNYFGDSADRPLLTMALPGGTPRPIGNLTGHDAAWSPDGSHICYAREDNLYVAKSDGTESKQIASLPGPPSWPRWSPDASTLRFTVQDPSGNTTLWEVSPTGTNPHALLPGWNSPPAECCGSWSSNGKYFVFQSTREGSTSLWNYAKRVRCSGIPVLSRTGSPRDHSMCRLRCLAWMDIAFMPSSSNGVASWCATMPDYITSIRTSEGYRPTTSSSHEMQNGSHTPPFRRKHSGEAGPMAPRNCNLRRDHSPRSSPLVSGRQTDRVHGIPIRGGRQDLPRATKWRRAGIDGPRRLSSDRSQLVARRQLHHVCKAIIGKRRWPRPTRDSDF